jgi:tetratricopeptide (TPR) repeat protein
MPNVPWLVWLAALFVLALGWRLAYFGRLRDTPFWGSLAVDARIYWDWSEHILRHGVASPATFFLAPLYPYTLALMRVLSGGSFDGVLTAQALLSAASVVLLADATRRVAGPLPAIIVGVVLAVFRTSVFFAGLVLPETLLSFLASVLVWFVARTDWPRAGLAAFAMYGLLVGLLTLGRASAALLVALVIALAGGESRARRIRSIAVALAVFAACALRSALANLRASGEIIPFTYNLGFNLYVGNNPDATGTYVTTGSTPSPLEGTAATTGGALDGRADVFAREGRRLEPAESSRYWAAKAFEFVRAEPLAALRLAGKKLLLAWNYVEAPQNENMESLDRVAGPLGPPVVGGFGLLAVIGLGGAAFAVRGGPAERWLVGYLALVTLALVPIFVTDRYRFHLVPALTVLAGLGGRQIARALRGADAPARVRALVTAGLATAIVLLPVRARPDAIQDWELAADHAARLLERGAYAEAATEFARAEASAGGLRKQMPSTSARAELASFHYRYGLALQGLGRSEDAVARWERAIALNPADAPSLARLASAYERANRAADVERIRRALGSVASGRAELLLNDGWAAARRGDMDAAEWSFLDAAAASPGLAGAWHRLIRIRIQQGRFDDASKAVEQARTSGLDAASADIYECFLAAERGDLARATRVHGRIPAGAANADPNLGQLLERARRRLGL